MKVTLSATAAHGSRRRAASASSARNASSSTACAGRIWSHARSRASFQRDQASRSRWSLRWRPTSEGRQAITVRRPMLFTMGVSCCLRVFWANAR
jgi:hypothetical protein